MYSKKFSLSVTFCECIFTVIKKQPLFDLAKAYVICVCAPPENLIAEKEKIYKLKPLGYLYLDIQGILKSQVPKSGW